MVCGCRELLTRVRHQGKKTLRLTAEEEGLHFTPSPGSGWGDRTLRYDDLGLAHVDPVAGADLESGAGGLDDGVAVRPAVVLVGSDCA